MQDQSCRIFLVRHGQTVLNREVRFRGIRDVPLDEVGRAEALQAALSLRDSGITKVYTSPLGRAQEVARRIAFASGVQVVDDMPLLKNLDYGEWEGLTKHECAARDPQQWALYADAPEQASCPGGERVADAADRVMQALRILSQRHPGEAVAAVSHGVMLRLAVLRIQGAPASGWQFKVPTGSAIEFAGGPHGVRLITTIEDAEPDPYKDPTILAPARLRKAR
jgi:broad specificity phosphatase PhoE